MTTQSSPQPPDGGWGWMVVFGGFVVSGCTAGIFRSLGVFFLTFSRQFQASSAETAWITSILMGVTLFLSPVGTALASTIGFRPTIMLGGVLSAAGYIISGFATRMFHLYLGIGCLTGLGYALTLSPTLAIVGQYFTKRRALANSLTMLGSSVTSMSFPPLFQYLMDEYGLKGALLIIGGVMLNMVVAGALIRPLEAYRDRKVENERTKAPSDRNRKVENGPTKAPSDRDMNVENGLTKDPSDRDRLVENEPPKAPSDRDVKVENGPTKVQSNRGRKVQNGPTKASNNRMKDKETVLETDKTKKWSSVTIRFLRTFWAQMDFKVMKIPAVAVFMTTLFLVSFGVIVPPMYIVPRAKQLQIEDYTAASLLSVISIADMISRLAVGAIPDNSRFGRLDQYGLSLCLLGISNLMSPLAKTYPALVAYAIAHGVCFGVFVPTSLTAMAELVGPRRLPSAIGILMAVQGLASLSGPPFAGWLFDVTKSYDATFLQADAGFLLAGLLPFLLRLRKKRPADTSCTLTNTAHNVNGETDILLVYETSV